jgi:hypothetical protein
MTKRDDYPPQYGVPGQAPSRHRAYDPRVQPDEYANRDKRGEKPLRYVPDGLADTGDFLYQRTEEQRREAKGRQKLSYLGSSVRSINAHPSAVYALFSADGTPQDIPAEENVLLVGTFPLAYDQETRTYFPDITGSASPSTSVTVTNAANNGVFVRPGTGAVFPVSVSGTANVSVQNTVGNPVPVVLAAGSFPFNVTVDNNVATEGIPVVNQTGEVLDVNISSADINVPVAVQGNVAVTFAGAQPVTVQNVVTAQITGTVTTVSGAPAIIPGANISDAVALPAGVSLLYGREGTNTNSPVAVDANGAILTSSVGTTGVDGTVTIDNPTGSPVPTLSQDTKRVVGDQLTTQSGLVTTSVIYVESGTDDYRAVTASGASPTAIDVNVVQTVGGGGGGSAQTLIQGAQDQTGTPRDLATANRAIDFTARAANPAPPDALLVLPVIGGFATSTIVAPADGATIEIVSDIPGVVTALADVEIVIEGSVATPPDFAVEIRDNSVAGNILRRVPLKLGTVGGIDRSGIIPYVSTGVNSARNFVFTTDGDLTGTDIRVTINSRPIKVA